MHASPYGSKMYNTHQFDPQLWGGPYPSLKVGSVWSSLCSFSVRNRTGGKPRFDPQMWGDPIRAQKWSRCGLHCVHFLFGNDQEANCGNLFRCESPGKEPEMAGAFPCARSMSCARASVWHLCVYLGVCVDECKLACACACENECNKGCSISVVCH